MAACVSQRSGEIMHKHRIVGRERNDRCISINRLVKLASLSKDVRCIC